MSKSLRPPPEAPWAAGLLTAGLCLVAAGAPLAWTRLVVAEYTLPKLLALCLGLLCAAAGLLLSLRPGRPLFRSRLDLPALACLLALGASAFASQDPLLSLLGQYNNYSYGLWALALYAAAYFLSARCPAPAQRRLVLDFTLGAALAVSAYAVLQAAGLEPFTLSAELPTGRSVSTIGSPVHLGEYLALLFPLALQRALSTGSGRLLGMLGLPLMSLALWSTVSRGAWLAALAGTAFYWAFSGRPRQSLSGLPRMLAALLLLALLLLPASRIISRSASASDIGRIETWKTAWASFAGSPWLGSGPDTFCEIHRKNRGDAFIRAMGPTAHSGDAHNDLLQVLSTTGLAGGLAYLWLLAALALEAARVMRVPGRQDEAAAISGGLLAFFLNMKLNPVSVELMAVAAVLAGALCSRNQDDSAPIAAGRLPNLILALLLALSLASAGLCLRLLAADRHVQLARIQIGLGNAEAALLGLRRGLSLNACELKYRIIQVNLLVERVRQGLKTRPRSELESWLEEAARSGSEAVRCHPADVNSRYLQGYVSLVQAQIGLGERLAAAESALDRALALDPDFGPLLQLRLEAAGLRGDRSKAAEIQGRFERLRALRPG